MYVSVGDGLGAADAVDHLVLRDKAEPSAGLLELVVNAQPLHERHPQASHSLGGREGGGGRVRGEGGGREGGGGEGREGGKEGDKASKIP